MKKFTFPVYEVVTPVTGKHFFVRAMTVAQESLIRESVVSDAKRLSIINQIIFECIEDKQPPYNTMEGFEKNLTNEDRAALMFGLAVSTYGEKQDYSLKCPKCGADVKGSFLLPEIVELNMYDGDEDLLNKEITVELPVSKYKAVLRIPTLYDERVLTLTKGISKEVIAKMGNYLVVKKLIIPGVETSKDGESIEKEYVVDKVIEIYSTLNNLPARDSKYIFKQWTELLGKYSITLKLPAYCASCGEEFTETIDPLMEFFRIMLS